MSKQKIVTSGSDRQENHRADFETCPNCGHRMEHEEWKKYDTTLILSPRCIRVNSVAVMSECPKCFVGSWVHEQMNMFSFNLHFPETWKKKVKELEEATKLKAARDWGKGLCWNCKHLQSAKIDYNTWRTCILGMGPAETKCSKFSKC